MWIVHAMPFHSPWMRHWHCLIASLSFSMSPCGCLVYLRRDACVIAPSLTYMMFPNIVERDCYIYISVSEIHSGNCEKSTVHGQNIILTLIGLGFFDMFRFGGL